MYRYRWIKFCTLIVLTLATLCVGKRKVWAQFAHPASCTGRAEAVRAELDMWAGQGVGFLYWQYSGDIFGNFVENDIYSFFNGDPTCQVLAEYAPQFSFMGVNIYGLTNHPEWAEELLSYVSSNCGVNMIRIWATPDRQPGNTPYILDVAQAHGIKVIVTLLSQSTHPTRWYTEDFLADYEHIYTLIPAIRGKPALYGYELNNEPHCGGDAACINPYIAWADNLAGIIRGLDGSHPVGIGQMASQQTTRGDSPGAGDPPDYLRSNSSSNIQMASAHYYNAEERASAMLARQQAGSLGKTFYIGEMGVDCTGSSINSNAGLPRMIVGKVTGSKTILDENGSEETEYPVSGATVCAYQGTQWHNGEWSNSGNMGSNIYSFYAGTTTNAEGFYHLDTAWIATGDNRSFHALESPPSNFVAFLCGRELKELYQVDIRKTHATLGLNVNPRYEQAYRRALIQEGSEPTPINPSITLPPLDVAISCDASASAADFEQPAQDPVTMESHPECPAALAYLVRNESAMTSIQRRSDNFIMSFDPFLFEPNQLFPTHNWAAGDDRSHLGGDPDDVPPVEVPEDNPPEGRVAILGSGEDPSRYAQAAYAIAGGFLEGFFGPIMAGGSGNQLFNCESLRAGNVAVNTAFGSATNALKANGFAVHLASPPTYEDLEDHPESICARYQTTNKARKMCNATGIGTVTLGEIQPPRGCMPPEEYCNPGGTLPSGEDCPYKLSSAYFPYWALFLLPSGSTLGLDMEVISDSYVSPSARAGWWGGDPQSENPTEENTRDPFEQSRGNISQEKVLRAFSDNNYGFYAPASFFDLVAENVSGIVPSTHLLATPSLRIDLPPNEAHKSYTQEYTRGDITYTLAGLPYVDQTSSVFKRLGTGLYLPIYPELDGDNLFVQNARMATLYPCIGSACGRWEPIYDFIMASYSDEYYTYVAEDAANDTIFGREHTGIPIFGALFEVIAQFVVNLTNWLTADGSCVSVQNATCTSYTGGGPEEGACSYGDCSGCEQGGCHPDADAVYCVRDVTEYTCAPPIEHHIRIQSRVPVKFPNKNDGYSFDGFVASLLPPSEKIVDTAAGFTMDGYGTTTDRNWEGGLTNSGKDSTGIVDLLTKIVRAPQYIPIGEH